MSDAESRRADAQGELEHDALVERYWVAAEYVAEGIHKKRCGGIGSPHGRVAALQGNYPCGYVFGALTSVVRDLTPDLMRSFVARSGVAG